MVDSLFKVNEDWRSVWLVQPRHRHAAGDAQQQAQLQDQDGRQRLGLIFIFIYIYFIEIYYGHVSISISIALIKYFGEIRWLQIPNFLDGISHKSLNMIE